MSFETFALIWPFVSIVFVVGATLFLARLQDRAHDRKTRTPSP
jgi:hypothetical protein